MTTPHQAVEKKPDYKFMITLGVIIFLGLIILASAGTAVGYQKFGDSYYFIKHQVLYGLLPGLLLFFILSRVNYQHFKKIANVLFFSSIVLLALVFIPGIGAEYGTAKSWVNILGISFQPAELVKITFLIYLANWLEKRGETGVRDLYSGLVPFLFLVGVISVLMIKQPDMGTLSIIIVMCMCTFYASGARLKHVMGVIAIGLGAIVLLIKAAPYRAARLTTFLHPELDPLGIGYHINQAFMAIGSGRLFGRGLGNSRQKFLYLPEVTGDSIFAIYAEEMGFFFSVLLVGLFTYLLIRGLKIAERAPDTFGRLISIGIISWFTFQAFFNISSMVGILPMTGIPIPFISAGGTSLAVNLAAAGILINISKQAKKQ